MFIAAFLQGGGSTLASQTINVVAGLFSSNPSYFYTIDYNDPAISTDVALQQVKNNSLDFAISLTPFSGDSSMHSVPFLGIGVALIANIPGSSPSLPHSITFSLTTPPFPMHHSSMVTNT
jgi:hypothetical protein